ncbi:LOW QUALITY PROTEIN: Hypothetical protein PHPALM_36166 [Phytophthora palmivora]|uniref:Uncharacterized protein n=1 Tax=Phytophthora palmivora TaxID=4796 RepID=A0A2P4X0K6_9STRA|nr:LOW QUALITY PROTEIN: Hypothetical protein PHPALM_36166 [Phytophthora palmivora]
MEFDGTDCFQTPEAASTDHLDRKSIVGLVSAWGLVHFSAAGQNDLLKSKTCMYYAGQLDNVNETERVTYSSNCNHTNNS